MLQDQRTFKRFDIRTVVEFKPMKEFTKSPFFGIMKNFSYGGFSLETQYDDLEPGENLEFKFKHPNSDLYVTDTGQVIWKDKANKYESLMGIKLGIKFRELNIDSRMKMLEIVSAAGEMPVDFFLLDRESEKGQTNREEEEFDSRFNAEPKVISIPETVQRDLDHIHDERSGNNEMSRADRTTRIDQETGGPVNEVFDFEGVEKSAPAHEVSPVSNVHEREDNALQKEMGQANDDHTSSGGKNGKQRKWGYVLIALVIAVVSGYALSIMFKNHGNGLRTEVPASKELANQEDGDEKSPGTVSGNLRSHGSVAQGLPQSGNQREAGEKVSRMPENEGAERSGQALADIQKAGSEKYFIQVGAWRNPEYAREMLVRLKKDYPDAYMIMDNNFHKVRIPDIRNEAQGRKILNDMDVTVKKFNLRPLFVKELPRSGNQRVAEEKAIKLLENEGGERSEQSSANVRTKGSKEYFIQVGTWRNPKYAREMLARLKKDYTNTYMVIDNDFYTVRIPDIKNKEQGKRISRDIEGKFNMTPLLILKR